MGVQKVGQIMLKGLERRGASPDLHQVSVLASQLGLLPLLLAPKQQVDAKHLLQEQPDCTEEGLARADSETLQGIHVSNCYP